MSEERISRLEKEMKEVMDVAYEAKNHIESHEDVCSVRYEGLKDKISTMSTSVDKINTKMWLASGSAIATLVTVVLILLFK
jgi:hypothetical protein